jgi:hypothetical protein
VSGGIYSSVSSSELLVEVLGDGLGGCAVAWVRRRVRLACCGRAGDPASVVLVCDGW